MKQKNLVNTERFIEDISKSIEVIIRKNFSQVSEDDKADISQEVKIKIWKMLSCGKNIKNFRSYLWKVVYTTALDFINKKRKYLNLEAGKRMNVSNCFNELRDISAESLLEQKVTKKVLMSAIDTLSQNRRIVIKLGLTGMNITEIANFLGWSRSKINHLYYRGLEDLKKKLKYYKGSE